MHKHYIKGVKGPYWEPMILTIELGCVQQLGRIFGRHYNVGLGFRAFRGVQASLFVEMLL